LGAEKDSQPGFLRHADQGHA